MRSAFRSRRAWLGILFSLLALYYAARGVDWPELVTILRGASYGWILPAALAVVLGQFARARRWQRLFPRASRPRYRPTFAVLCVGYLVSTVFPLRLGDPFRVWAIGRFGQARISEALASLFVERLLDFLTILLFLAALAPEPGARLLGKQLGPGFWADPGALRWIALAFLGAAYLFLMVAASLGLALGPRISERLARAGLNAGLADRAARLVTGVAQGLRPLRRPLRALSVTGWSVLVWGLGAFGYWLVMLAFDMRLGYAAAAFVMCAAALAAILPSTPGYAGVFHAAVVIALEIWGVADKDLAFSYALVNHAVTIGVLVIMGPIGLRMLGMSGRELGRSVEAGRAIAASAVEPGEDGVDAEQP